MSLLLKEQKNPINTTIKEELANEIISKEEYKAMDLEDKNPSKLYCLFRFTKRMSIKKHHLHNQLQVALGL